MAEVDFSPVGAATELCEIVCWDQKQVTATIETEAVSPSPAVFFATHTPLRIHRSGPDGVRPDNPGAAVDEEAVREDFLTRPPANGVLLLPVIGESGTGKSHLVRWVHERTPTTDRRHVIYLPKYGTSLKTLVTRLLAGRTEGPLAQLAARVESVTSGLDRPGLEERLLNGLQEALVAAAPTPQTRQLVGRGRLETLLTDPYVRSHLRETGRLVPRLAANLLSDRHGGEGERPLEFAVEDLPLDLARATDAARPTQKMIAMLRSRPELAREAVTLLNQGLGEAVANAADLGSGQLSRALLEIRRELAREGKEIVLLIEDFALIQGVQRELLDAVVEAGVRGGERIYAPIRTLLAVTTGYYRDRLVDTVQTRASAATPYVYDLDVQFDDTPAGLEEVAGFVGRYLNAARLGRTALDDAGVRSAGSTPNACDRCRLREPCHGGFGASAAGHGLYPFNRSALQRAIRARAPRANPKAFNPRSVVGEVIRNVLQNDASAIEAGEFPGARFADEYSAATLDLPTLPVGVRADIANRDPSDAERRTVFLEFWGGAPQHLRDLDLRLHTAFGIEPLGTVVDGSADSEPEPTVDEQPDPRPKPQVRPSVDRHVAVVEAWGARGERLRTGTALELRRIVRDAVVNRAQWNRPLMAEPTADVLRGAWPNNSTTVSIEGAEAENLPGTAHAPITLGRNPQDAVFLQGLLAVQEGDVAGRAAVVRRLAAIADRYRPHLVRGVQERECSTDEHLVVAMRAALLGAALAGRAWPGMDEADLLGCVVDDGSMWRRGDAADCSPQWRQAWERHRPARAGLVRTIRRGLGVARGVSGAIRMIDAARALPLVRNAAAEPWTWTPSEVPVAAVRSAVEGFGRWDTLIDEQFGLVERRGAAIRGLVPVGTRGTTVVQRVGAAFNAAVQTQLFSGDVGAVTDALAAAEGWAWESLGILDQDLAGVRRATSDAQRVRARTRAALRDRGPDLERIARFLEQSQRWLDAALARARSTADENDHVHESMAEVIRRWDRIEVATP